MFIEGKRECNCSWRRGERVNIHGGERVSQ